MAEVSFGRVGFTAPEAEKCCGWERESIHSENPYNFRAGSEETNRTDWRLNLDLCRFLSDIVRNAWKCDYCSAAYTLRLGPRARIQLAPRTC